MTIADWKKVPGATADRWYSRFLRVVLVWVGWGLATGLVNFARPAHESHPGAADYVFWSFFTTWMVLIVPGIIVGAKARMQQSAELRAGYSTLPYQKAPVDIYDEKSGLLLRGANDKPLATKDDLIAARDRARRIDG